MKKILSAALALAMTLSIVPAAFAAGGTAYASTQIVEVDGKKVEFQMYALKDAAGNPTNYVKLRDVAHVLNGTKAQFSVGYDGSISVTTGQPYADAGGEMTTPYSGDRAYRDGSGSVKVNGQSASLESIILTDDAGGDYTYFKLRDLGAALGFNVDWSADRGVVVETGGSTQPTTPTVKPVSEFTLEDLQGIWYAEVDGLFQMEISINGNQLSQTYLDADGGCLYEIATIVAVERNYRDPGDSEITPLYLKLKNETETSVSDGTVEMINHETSQRYFYDYPGEVGVFATGTGVPFHRASTLKLYPQYETALAAAQSKPSAPDDTDINPMDYAYTAMEYLYDHLKFPSTMDVSAVKCGKHVSNHIFEKTDNVYVVTITYEAANSFGVLRTSNYVTMFNLTTGKTMFDAVGYTKSMIDGSWGAAKSKAYMKNSEALGLSGGGTLSTELTREQIQSLVDQIKK